MESVTPKSSPIDVKKIIDRVKLVITEPKTCWPQLQQSPETPTELTISFVAPLVILGAIVSFVSLAIIGMSIPGVGLVRLSFFGTLISQIVGVALRIGLVFVMAKVVEFIAEKFGAATDYNKAFKLVAYSMVPGMLAALTVILPWFLYVLPAIALAIYGIYIFHQGVPSAVSIAPEQHVKFTVVAILCTIVVNIVITAVITLFTPSPHFSVTGSTGTKVDLETIHNDIQKLQKSLAEPAK